LYDFWIGRTLSERTLLLLSAGGEVRNRFAVIEYDNSKRKFIYSAKFYNMSSPSYICQLHQQQGLFKLYPLGDGKNRLNLGYILLTPCNVRFPSSQPTLLQNNSRLQRNRSSTLRSQRYDRLIN